MVLASAAQEAQARGDRRIGTDHLLLGLLDDPDSVAARALGVDLEAARAASAALDRAALAAVGIDLGDLGVRPQSQLIHARRRPPLTSGARAVLQRSLQEASASKSRYIEVRHLLLALLSRERPDPAAELLAALGVDPAEARDRLTGSAA
ncbi:MAG TPA: Clp protease N-terminal domain-containing protein [Actinomycetes bacterium]|jgi:ATP-dependent Clp protease ATP-binding subunit ClpA|nr:Clp protease N-terminal domain-containing protein [Actinomycetes bacterium]